MTASRVEELMLHSSSLIAFVATAKPGRAKRFYEEALGLTLLENTPFALVFDANGVTLRLQKVQTLDPAPHTVLGWRVADVQEAVSSLTTKGVAFERYRGLEQDETGVWSSPSGAQVAWFKDPDGNVLSLTQEPAPTH
jgi:catechol 2,3-dioxygenase-like lactoylglutathione lyase family enzyme